MTVRQSFFESTTNGNIWNKVIEWNGRKIGTVRWHNDPWKLVLDSSDFDTIKTDYKNEHSLAFRTQADLWEYLKAN